MPLLGKGNISVLLIRVIHGCATFMYFDHSTSSSVLPPFRKSGSLIGREIHVEVKFFQKGRSKVDGSKLYFDLLAKRYFDQNCTSTRSVEKVEDMMLAEVQKRQN